MLMMDHAGLLGFAVMGSSPPLFLPLFILLMGTRS